MSGHYVLESAYPMTQWLVMEAYNDLYYTTGITYQADNQPTPTTVVGAGVDVSMLPIIGLGGRMDWGVHAYDADGRERHRPAQRRHRRHRLLRHDPQRARPARTRRSRTGSPASPDLTVELYAPCRCPDGRRPSLRRPGEQYQLAPTVRYASGQLLNTYVTETWEPEPHGRRRPRCRRQPS